MCEFLTVVSNQKTLRFIKSRFVENGSVQLCKNQKHSVQKMPKLEKFSEVIDDDDLLPDLSIRADPGKHHCSMEQMVAIMNEILEILQGLTDCLSVGDLYDCFVEGWPRNVERFDEFPDFWHGCNMIVFESAVKFLANEGYVQLEPNLHKGRKIVQKMIIGCHENARVENVGLCGFFVIDQSN